MAFRGVLLQLVEAESEAGFRVVAPDVELTLPPHPVPVSHALLTKWSQQKVVLTDAVSRKLLQVARLATVALKQEEMSVLWAVTAPFAPPKDRTVGATPLENYMDGAKAVKKMRASSSLIVKADMPLTPSTEADAEPPKRLCYCFHFRSNFEYELFAHTLASFTRMQRYALLRSSVVMEMEISHEHKTKRAQEKVRLQALASKAQQRFESLQAKKEVQEKKKTLQPQVKAKTKSLTATLPSKMLCALCRIQRKPDTPEYPKHPFVLKDGKGEVVHICKVCLQRVLKQRLATQASAKQGGQDNACGLCAQSTDKMSAKSIKVCAHKVCPRVYCIACIDKLIGKAQAHKVWRTKNWLCPNCSTDDDSASADVEEDDAGPVSVEIEAASAPKQKKRKRCNKNSTADEDGPSVPASSALKMKPIDYVVAYFKFLLKREMKDKLKESEDVCFCCKDGGDVIECDWKGINGTFERCPKVYHEDCLGYEVPEGKTWVCPRHRCQDCGVIALYSCRFCVTSYCEDHLPKDVKRIGNATKDISTSTYVMCSRCNEQAQDAFKQKKIGSGLLSKLLRRRTGKR